MKPPSPFRFALLIAVGLFLAFFLADHWVDPYHYTYGDGVIPHKINPNDKND